MTAIGRDGAVDARSRAGRPCTRGRSLAGRVTGRRACLVTVAALWACGDAPSGAPAYDDGVPEEERYGGTAVIAGTGAIESFNPAALAEDLSSAVQRDVVLMTLLRAGPDLEPRPYLASSWRINEDSTRVEFELRDDVAWEDGRPTTAHDVAFTFAALKNPEVGFPNARWFSGWEGPEVVDDRTISFAVRPHAGLLGGWTRLPILPRHVFEGTSADRMGSHGFGTDPVGNGPFRFVERQGDVWIFEANPGFPEELGGRPYLDRLVYRQIPEPTTQMAEMQGGGVHLIRSAPPAQIRRAGELPELAVEEVPTRAYGFIAWNGARPAFSEPAVRRALTMAIDRSGIVDAVRGGLGTPANGPIGPWHPAHDPALEPLPFSPDSAGRLLEAAGWTDSDGDGVRDRDGRAFAFELITGENPTYRDIAEIAQAQLGAVGVDASVRGLDNSAFIDRILSPERRYDAFVLEWVPEFEMDPRALFACSALGEGYQFASYCNPALDPILDSIPSARSREDVERGLRAFARIVREDQPFTFLYFARDGFVRRRELRGVTLDIRGDLIGVRGWWLHPAARPDDVPAAEPG